VPKSPFDTFSYPSFNSLAVLLPAKAANSDLAFLFNKRNVGEYSYVKRIAFTINLGNGAKEVPTNGTACTAFMNVFANSFSGDL